MISMPISGRVRVARGELMLGEELGLHRSNRLPWKRIFLESCLRVSQMELTSSWQSDSAVRAHVWKASQWLWQTKDHQISAASAISLKSSSPSYSMQACTGCCGLIYLPKRSITQMATLASSKSNWALITMATESESETISQMILQVGNIQQKAYV